MKVQRKYQNATIIKFNCESGEYIFYEQDEKEHNFEEEFHKYEGYDHKKTT
jgi:hypothetical protein